MYVGRLLQLFKMYLDGHLPEPGTIIDQPNLLIEAFSELTSVKNALDAEEIKNAGKESPSDGFVSVRRKDG
jgi:hypothetical protein